MAQQITLYGGPMHGQSFALEDGLDHFHIREMLPPEFKYGETGSPGDTLKTREGTYSRVGRSRTEFEWDGWRIT
ncbi:hypothetical protein FDJ34_gp47 [Microbacterium phage Eleri]|uniref:Uncharacterized protein n=2 Tax=Elerivirus eleri TaxID=2560589 RepID=A0A6N0A4H9_9CAUD|nr:hypothetical protein FDJ34_gp47 [Microbacterium phage Eleri]AUX83385.1 hypothetical protein SEA_ELERI_47 [Microbacterium phage Eleri]QKO02675.1 hypothetical protein SEA_GLAMOUR_47 [Microbacterium phage Glamour]UDG79021.1 hypothetical protein SEA_SARATOS_47 [Microbacterium phage Saratos]